MNSNTAGSVRMLLILLARLRLNQDLSVNSIHIPTLMNEYWLERAYEVL